MYFSSRLDGTGGMATEITQRVSAAWRNSLEVMLWSNVRQEDASETEWKGLQNCGPTSYVVCCIDRVNNERTISTPRSK